MTGAGTGADLRGPAPAPRVAAVVLAAGAGSRFSAAGGTHKLLAPVRGVPVVRRAVDAAVEAGIGQVWVVTGAADIEGVLPPAVRVLANPRWAEGQATSLAVAVDAARREGLDAIVVGLGDQPFIGPGPWRAVAATSSAPVAVATYGGRRANPVRLGRSVWGLLARSGDAGARTLMRQRPELIEQVACEGEPVDIDTVEDLSAWN